MQDTSAVDAFLEDILFGDGSDNNNDPVAWMEKEFWIPEGDGRLHLAPYQKAVIREADRKDENGNYIYSVVVWSDIKKSIKSTIAAARALYGAFHTPYGSLKIVANDLKQADSRVAYYARRAIELNPKLDARAKVINYKTTIDNRAVIEAIPVDPKGEAGGNDDFICFSELWAANQKAAQRMWTEMTLSPTKFGKSQRWVETYAGFRGESPLLEQLWDTGVNLGQKLDLSFEDATGFHDLSDLEVYANGGMLVLWNGTPRCDWQTNENGRKYYEEERRILDPAEFDRVHRNIWGSASSPFLPIEWWDLCKGVVDPIGEFQSVMVSLDAATTNDTFAINVVSRKGRLLQHRECMIWTPGGKNNKLDFALPEAYIRQLATKYNVSAFVYDPYQLHDMATRLRDEGVGYFEPFNQGAARLRADKQLYDIIRDRRIVHDGSHPELRQHIINASKTSGEGHQQDQMRIIKRAPTLPIDAVVSLSMCCERAIFYNIGD